MDFSFKKATKKKSRLRMALFGPSGGGKTYTSLAVATHLLPDARIAVIDTESGSASKYADLFDFSVLEIDSYAPQTYVKALKIIDAEQYDVAIIDSLSHAWTGTDGALQMVDKAAKRSQSGNTFTAWRDVTPEHNKMVDAILRSKAHVIATMRSKTEYVMEANAKGRTVPRKIGLAPIQRDGMEYEFDVVGQLDIDNGLSISKTRCSMLAGAYIEKPGESFAKTLREWLSDGVDEVETMRSPSKEGLEEIEAEKTMQERLANKEISALFDQLNAPEAKRIATLTKYKSDKKVVELLKKRIEEAEA